MAKKPAADQPHPESKRGAKPLSGAELAGDLTDAQALTVRHGERIGIGGQGQYATQTQ